ncbi:glycoside hydrolase [bacterium]|nr:MAG: glycoside hydrolase [bacterium]
MTFAPSSTDASSPRNGRLYTNPVWDQEFGDPFILAHTEGYVAFGTGPTHGGGAIPTLLSEDLVHWRAGEPAIPMPERAIRGHAKIDVWAPEALAWEGRFYLYYSTDALGEGHRIHVAVADRAEGPYLPVGPLSDPALGFSIDGHPFHDRVEDGGDGSLWFFFASDVLDGDRPGTTLFADRMISPTELAGEAHVVLRANSDWAIYARQRAAYGGVYDWHTLEGPFVLRRGGRLVMLFSGGNFHDETYGVDFATADHPLGPWHLDPVEAPRVLRTVPGSVIGPGHNSVVSLPPENGGGDLIVYHAWNPDLSRRTLRLDPLRWTEDGPRVDGPTVHATDLLR